MPAILPLLTKDKSKRRKKKYGFIHHQHNNNIIVPTIALCSLLSVLYYLSTQLLLTKNDWYHSDNYVDKNCRLLSPIQQPDLSQLSSQRRERYVSVQDAIRHAWQGYANVVGLDSTPGGTIPYDDLSPVSGTAFSWLNYAATLYDSIDTLYLANLTEEYEQAVHWATTYDIQTTSIQATKTFGTFVYDYYFFFLVFADAIRPQNLHLIEYSLRVIGGLLGAYSLSGDPRLFATAQNAADAILEGPFKASPTIIPRPFNVLAPTSHFWDWKATIQRTYQAIYNFGRNRFTEEHRRNSLAGFGSFGLEFSFLSTFSGDSRYRKVSDNIFRHVMAYEKNGIVPNSWDVLTGEPITRGGSLGSGSDSFYEYLLKIPLLESCYYDVGMEMFADSCTVSGKKHLEQYEKTVKEALGPYHTRRGSISDLSDSEFVFPIEHRNRYDHLLCFLPGLLALGASVENGSSKQNDMSLAHNLMEGCAALYKISATGLSPDTAFLQQNSVVTVDPAYYLRPEYVESLFVMYRTSKDESIQEMGWSVFESLEKYCRLEVGGYAGLKDVNQIPPAHVDDMPSYFLAETLKYLLLLFGPDDYISLDDFVFTTEAHPLRKLKLDEKHEDLPFCILQSRPPAPVPWALLLIVSCIATTILGLFYIVWKVSKILLSIRNDKSKTL
jgi:mannosyl-oligosaccharide alpha-1,2-mannosidase